MNRMPTKAEMEAGMKAAPPNLERLEEVVRIREGLLQRAVARDRESHRNRIAAMIHVCHAKAERAEFISRQGMLL